MRVVLEVIILSFLLVSRGFATEPFPSEEYVSLSGRYRIILSPGYRGSSWDERLLELIDRETKENYSFSFEQLGLGFEHQNTVMSTAGLGWYRNSIAAFDEEEKFFVIKLPWSQSIVLDLQEHKVVGELPNDILTKVTESMKDSALRWLDSDDPYQRQTAAMVCGDLKVTQAALKLKDLLRDESFYTTYSGSDNEGTIVLYVRKAAKEALSALGEDAGHVRTELPEKTCLTFKGYQYVIDWDHKACQ